MKNKKIDANKLLLGAKKTVLKAVADEKKKENSIETFINTIHSEHTKRMDAEETKRTTIDIPKSLHKRINQRILDKDIPSMKEYFLNLALLDLGVE